MDETHQDRFLVSNGRDSDILGDSNIPDNNSKENGMEFNGMSSACVDDNVLDFMTGLMDRIRSSSGRSLKDVIDVQTDWFRKVNPQSAPVAFSYDLSRSITDAEELKRAMRMKEILGPSSLFLQQLSDLITSQLEDCSSQISALRCRTGLSSLPDEILGPIMEMAAFTPAIKTVGEGGEWKARSVINSIKAAVKLSSVCQRFRQLSVNYPDLWNHVCVGMPQEMLSTCVERAGAAGLHVFFDLSVSGMEAPQQREALMRPFLEFIAPYVDVWRSFSYHCYPFVYEPVAFPITEMANLEFVTNGLRAPQLTELLVRYEDGDYDVFSGVSPLLLHYYSTWNLPSLRSMRTFNLIPIPFSGSASIESLLIEMDYRRREMQTSTRRFDANALSVFLASCLVLKKLSLRLTYASLSPDIQSVQATTLNINELNLVLNSSSSRSIGRLLDFVRFPVVSTMKLIIRYLERPRNENRGPNSIIQVIFSNPGIFPRLEQLDLVASSTRASSSQNSSSTEAMHVIRLPLHNIPHLRFLGLHLHNIAMEPIAEDYMVPERLSWLYIGTCDDSMWAWIAELRRLLVKNGRALSLNVFVRKFHPTVQETWSNGGTEIALDNASA